MKSILAEIKVKCGVDKSVVRWHSDDDGSMQKEVAEWIRDNCWSQTNTGGYDSNRNAYLTGDCE